MAANGRNSGESDQRGNSGRASRESNSGRASHESDHHGNSGRASRESDHHGSSGRASRESCSRGGVSGGTGREARHRGGARDQASRISRPCIEFQESSQQQFDRLETMIGNVEDEVRALAPRKPEAEAAIYARAEGITDAMITHLDSFQEQL